MDADLEKNYDLVNNAIRAEDIFGALLDPENKKGPKEVLEDMFKALNEAVDPKKYSRSPDDQEIAQDIKDKLQRFYEKAVFRLDEYLYGINEGTARLVRPDKLIFKTGKREYYLGSPIAEGSVSTVFEGDCVMGDEFAGRVAIKIADKAEDNELLLREMRTMKMLHDSTKNQRRHLAFLLDHFMTSDGRIGLVFRNILEDGYDLYSIRDNPLHKKGVDQKHMVWMFKRALSAIGYAHSRDILHGNIEPSHLIIRPKDHNLFVIDWCWSIFRPWQTGDRFQIYTENFSAPEVKDEELGPTPASDLYSLGKCMIYIVGGDVETNELPDSVEEPLQRFLKSFVIKSQSQRVQDAWQSWGELVALNLKLWGKRKFFHFPM